MPILCICIYLACPKLIGALSPSVIRLILVVVGDRLNPKCAAKCDAAPYGALKTHATHDPQSAIRIIRKTHHPQSDNDWGLGFEQIIGEFQHCCQKQHVSCCLVRRVVQTKKCIPGKSIQLVWPLGNLSKLLGRSASLGLKEEH